ncbi:MAG: class I SAM-dependent methyltransferase [Pseudomonadota bacterium]
MALDGLNEFRGNTVEIEGWMTASAVISSLVALDTQREIGIAGNFLEIGSWHGKSAALWLQAAKSPETVTLMDIAARDELGENMQRLSDRYGVACDIIKRSSLSYNEPIGKPRSMRVIHIDGDHSAAGISNDIELTAGLLHPHGVMIIDDFMNPRFPQITEVTFDFVRRHTNRFSIVLVGGNKGFLVSAKFHDFWFEHFSKKLPDAFKACDEPMLTYEGSVQNRKCLCFRPA